MFDGVPHGGNAKKDEPLFRALAPAFALTPLIRPRLLLAAPTERMGLLVLGLLYHREKEAFQSRLQFDPPGLATFRRRTKWRQWSTRQYAAQRQESIIRLFTQLAHTVGVVEILRLQFDAHDSDALILRQLRTSPIASLVR